MLHMYLLVAKALLRRRSFREAREATESAAWLGEQLGFRWAVKKISSPSIKVFYISVYMALHS